MAKVILVSMTDDLRDAFEDWLSTQDKFLLGTGPNDLGFEQFVVGTGVQGNVDVDVALRLRDKRDWS